MPLSSQDCHSAQVYSQENFLYGRFEVSMRSASGDGIVSSFFLYNLDVGCNWPDENNELDIEMTGNTTDLYFTTHYPGPVFYTDVYAPGFNPHNGLHDYAFEWEPGIVRWFVDGQLVNVQDDPYVDDLMYPMRIMMNLWASDATTWVGVWDPSVMPVTSEYDYIRYYEYTPGSGNAGTGNNFTLNWEDNLDAHDPSRWIIEQDGGLVGGYCRFRPANVEWTGGKMIFTMDEAPANPQAVPVTFSVNTESLNLAGGDVIYLNGTFNDFCGTCMPMTQDGDIWSRTVMLEPGSHEYLFVKNVWEELGGAPQESTCDFLPCDEFGNYGIIVVADADPPQPGTPCWGTCMDCSVTTSTQEAPPSANRTLIGVYDLLGREVQNPQPGQTLIYLYDDGSAERRMVWE